MRTLPAFVSLILVAACTATPETPPPRAGEQRHPAPTTTATPTSTPSGRNVTLIEPLEGQAIQSNPMRISGTARTFENHVSIRVRDENGAVVLETWATATGELGFFNPWHKDVLLTKHPGAALSVEAFEVSAKDGSIQSLVRVSAPYVVPRKSVTLYMHDPKRAPTDCSVVFPVRHEVPASPSLARLLVESLIRMEGSPFPGGSEVGRIVIANGTASVDFNGRLQNVGGSCRAQAIRASVERTLRELPNVERVTITADGSESQALQP